MKTAVHFNAAIVSNDNYRDLMRENEEWKKHIENNLLQYSFVNDLFMIPEDPFGRNGPKLEDYLNLSNNTEIDKQTNNRNLSTAFKQKMKTSNRKPTHQQILEMVKISKINLREALI